MGEPFLPVPLAFLRGGFYQHPGGWGRAYLDLQMRSAPQTEIGRMHGREVELQPGDLLFSQRTACAWWGWHRSEVRLFLDFLQAEELISFPAGTADRRANILRLASPWWVVRDDPKNPSGRPSVVPKESSNGAVPRTSSPKGAPNDALVLAQVDGGIARKRASARTRTRGRASSSTLYTQELLLSESSGANAPTDSGAERRPGEPRQEAPIHALVRRLVTVGYNDAIKLTGNTYGEQAAVLKRLMAEHGAEMVGAAIDGMRKLFPFSKPERPPFSAYDVETHFTKSLAAANTKISDGRGGVQAPEGVYRPAPNTVQVKEQQERQRLAKHEEWTARVRARLLKEAPQEVRRYAEEARKYLRSLPGFSEKPEERRKQMIEAAALLAYGKAIGDLPPG